MALNAPKKTLKAVHQGVGEDPLVNGKTERAKESHGQCSQPPSMCVLKTADLGTQALLVVNSLKLHLTALYKNNMYLSALVSST